jgi:hypothetical protein
MLAGDRAADRDALLQHLGSEELGAVQLVGAVRVEKNERVQVAVAGMEYVRAAQAVLLLHLADESEHFAQALARNGPVHAVVVGRDAPDRRERRFAPRPETQAFRFITRHAHARRPGTLEHGVHARDLVVDLFRRAVRFAKEDRRGLEVISRADELLDRVRRGLVHHLEPCRHDAGGDHVGHRGAGLLDIVE